MSEPGKAPISLSWVRYSKKKRKRSNSERFSIFLVFFVVSMEEQIQNNLGVYVTSSFSLLPLTSTTSILSGVIGGVIKLPTAKFVDLIGRAEGFAIMTGFATLGESSSELQNPWPYWLMRFQM